MILRLLVASVFLALSQGFAVAQKSHGVDGSVETHKVYEGSGKRLHGKSFRSSSNVGRPAGCPPRAWCGCWLAAYKGITGAAARTLWLARNWARMGVPAAGPAPGVIAVMARGRGGHVGIITSVPGPGRIVMLSGNDGGAVRERERSTAGIIAYRQL